MTIAILAITVACVVLAAFIAVGPELWNRFHPEWRMFRNDPDRWMDTYLGRHNGRDIYDTTEIDMEEAA
jgi:hypothetical protein